MVASLFNTFNQEEHNPPIPIRRTPVPTSVANVLLLVFTVLLLRRFIQINFGVEISTLEALGVPATAALATILFKYLPGDAKAWIVSTMTSFLGSSVTTRFLISILVIAMLLCASITTTAVTWMGPRGMHL